MCLDRQRAKNIKSLLHAPLVLVCVLFRSYDHLRVVGLLSSLWSYDHKENAHLGVLCVWKRIPQRAESQTIEGKNLLSDLQHSLAYSSSFCSWIERDHEYQIPFGITWCLRSLFKVMDQVRFLTWEAFSDIPTSASFMTMAFPPIIETRDSNQSFLSY